MRHAVGDGYEFFADHPEYNFTICYRPIIATERRELGRMAAAFGYERTNKDAIDRHLVKTTTGDVPPQLELWVLGTMRLDRKDEQEQVNRLAHGVQLIHRYPAIGDRDCGQCVLYQFNEMDGKMVRDKHGQPLSRDSQPEHMQGPPCDWPGQTCPKGHYTEPKGFDELAKRAYVFHLECKAVGSWPDDPIVRRNARIIEQAIAEATDGKLDR